LLWLVILLTITVYCYNR